MHASISRLKQEMLTSYWLPQGTFQLPLVALQSSNALVVLDEGGLPLKAKR